MNTRTQDQEYLKCLSVLYVEDDEDIREQFSQFLSRLTGSVITAHNGAEGLEAYRKHNPDIIITDILMPTMNGLDMVKEIRTIDKSLPVIILTAFEELDYLKRAINIGVDKYITKPVNGMELNETLLDCAHELMKKQSLESAASTDTLTSLLNRRELLARFESEKSRAERHDSALALIMVDIDHFKRINDTYGHIAGDKILASVAATMSSLLRIQDICGRWGGEEFLIILPETNLNAAAIAAEKLRLAVSNLKTKWEESFISVTVSMGVGEFKPGMSMDECIQPIDEALYRAKNGGRNRFVLADN